MLSKKTTVMIIVFSVIYLSVVFLAFLLEVLTFQIAIPFLILDLPFAIALALMDREVKRDANTIENAMGGMKSQLDLAYSRISATIEDILSFRTSVDASNLMIDEKTISYIQGKIDEVSTFNMNDKTYHRVVASRKDIRDFTNNFYKDIENFKTLLKGAEKKESADFFASLLKCKDDIESSAKRLRVAGMMSDIGPNMIADQRDVKKWGWNSKKLLDELIKLDYETMSGLTRDMEGSIDQWADVFADSPETWRLLVNGSESIIGYWHFVPLFEENFQKALSGKLLDSEIKADQIKALDFPGDYDIYFVSIALRQGYRNHDDRILLFGSFFEVIHSLAKDGIFIKNIVTNAYTTDGHRTCIRFGMKIITHHMEHGDVFMRTMYPFGENDNFLERDTEIRELYTRHYDHTGKT
jgi:hypothetical protein